MRKDISLILGKMRRAAGSPSVVSDANPFRVLIATVLSQRTRDENTAKATRQLFERYRVPKEISNARLAELRELIRPSGFYKVKAARIKEISRQLVERFKGEVPMDMEELLSLPGVGRKTANCVLVYGFGKPAIPVDVHVNRISNRIGLVRAKTPEQTERELMGVVPKKNWLEFNHLMVRYGRRICLPRNPKCMQCEIRPNCNHFSAVVSKNRFK